MATMMIKNDVAIVLNWPVISGPVGCAPTAAYGSLSTLRYIILIRFNLQSLKSHAMLLRTYLYHA